jgi:hypothetical protein
MCRAARPLNRRRLALPPSHFPAQNGGPQKTTQSARLRPCVRPVRAAPSRIDGSRRLPPTDANAASVASSGCTTSRVVPLLRNAPDAASSRVWHRNATHDTRLLARNPSAGLSLVALATLAPGHEVRYRSEATLSEGAGIPSHLLLPPFHTRPLDHLRKIEEARAYQRRIKRRRSRG